LFKLFRARIPASTDDPNVELLAPFEAEASDVPGAILQRSSLAMHQLKALGFHSPIWHVIQDDLNQVKMYLATFSHDSGRFWARVHHRVWHVRTPARATMRCEMVSELADGRFLWTLSTKSDDSVPSSCVVVREPGAVPSRLLAAHEAALREMGASRVLLVSSTGELRAASERHHAAVRDNRLAHGVFTPLSVDERESAVAFRSSVQAAESVGFRYPEILAEVDRLQQKKASRSNGLMLLLVSAVLFFGAGLTSVGGNRFSVDILLILVGVVFFHEMGHWVAMRIFGYRNLKMFFIPFFGAAVTGRHYNVPGWKKAIVSLMGPLPGIIAGAGIGALGVAFHQPLLTKIAFIALALNGFNLLPILPLDGGWIVQAIFFSRHHLLELAFRLSALLALCVLALTSSDPILIGLAAVMGLALPAMYKLARITNELRKSQLPASSDDGQTLPHTAADVIIGKIKAVFPAKLANKVAAQYTLQIFENLNARPPGVLASIGLGFLHFGSIAASVIVAVMIFAGASNAKWRAVEGSSIAVVRTPGDSALATPRNIVVADFMRSAALAATVGALRSRPLYEVAVERYGQTLLVSLPSEDIGGLRDMQTDLEHRGATVLVATPADTVRMRMTCVAPSAVAGRSLAQTLGGYFNGRGFDLVPPWQPLITWPVADRARYIRARETYRTLADSLSDVNMDSSVLDIRRLEWKARGAKDAEQLAQLGRQRVQRIAELRLQRIRALRAVPALDTAVIDALASVEEERDSTTAFARGATLVAPLLGQLPLVDGRPAAGTDEWSADGSVYADNAKLIVPGIGFRNAFQGVPALTHWLLASGCRDVKYSFTEGIESKLRSASHTRSSR
jgi:Zn-dependent protease